MTRRRCTVVFAKPSRPGRVKTRLAADLSPEAAAALQAAFLDDLLAQLANGPWQLRVAWAVEPAEELPPGPIGSFRQSQGDLGERLASTWLGLTGEFDSLAIVGSDLPDLSPAALDAAFACLEAGGSVAVGPAGDGGFYLLAISTALDPTGLFEGIAWSGPEVLDRLLANCQDRGWQVELLAPGRDVDTLDDLRALERRLASRPGAADCPATRRLLASMDLTPAGAVR